MTAVEPKKASDLSLSLQIALALCSFFVAYGSLGSWVGSWSLQIFFLNPSCDDPDNTTSCCPTCLGVSNFQYSLYIAVPSIVAIGSVVISGLLVDILGLPTVVIVSALLNAFGNVLRAVGAAFLFNNNLVVAFLIAGAILQVSSNYALVSCREYIAIRYFGESKQPVVLAVALGVSYTSVVLSNVAAPAIATDQGVPTALWSFVALSMVGFFVGIILALIFFFSSAIRSFEGKHHNEQQEKASFAHLVKSVRYFPPQYWYIFFAFALTYSCQAVFESNAAMFQMRLGGIPSVEAGTNTAWAFFYFIIFSFLIGFFLWFTGPQIGISVVATLATTICMLFTYVKPTVGLFSIAISSIVHTSLRSLFAQFVPPEVLGLAGSLMFACALSLVGILSCIVGYILDLREGKNGAHVVLGLIIILLLLSIYLLVVLWFQYSTAVMDDTKVLGRWSTANRTLTESEYCWHMATSIGQTTFTLGGY